jgi:hypothetical protein
MQVVCKQSMEVKTLNPEPLNLEPINSRQLKPETRLNFKIFKSKRHGFETHHQTSDSGNSRI